LCTHSRTHFTPCTLYSKVPPISISLGLYYDSIQNDIGAERAFLEANRFNVIHPVQTERTPSTEQQPSVESIGHLLEDTPTEEEVNAVPSEIPEVQGKLHSSQGKLQNSFFHINRFFQLASVLSHFKTF
jgi:hypothetical protein